MNKSSFTIELQPRLPEKISRLQELSNNLIYSWDRKVRGLFFRIDRDLWAKCGHNPKLFLRRVSQKKLDEVTEDNGYMEEYQRVLISYDSYLASKPHPKMQELFDPKENTIAYFCAEFGLHESFPIYSGGLGILAGDHCKAASDLCLPFVAVGLLYQQGYFVQTINGDGQQLAHYATHSTEDLPIVPVSDEQGNQLRFTIGFPERHVHVCVWKASAGHITIYLLDTNLEENSEHDKAITHRLYGGDRDMRIHQEIILGIGGVRALQLMGIKPTVWHINEGHAAFQLLERYRNKIQSGMSFAAARELVAANTIFTTHTPVPAGHDIFSEALMARYFSDYVAELNIEFSELYALGSGASGFNMTSFALRSTRFHNGVSVIHGKIASDMEKHIWPQIPAQENPITSITNGVHLQTFLAREWVGLFSLRYDDWQAHLLEKDYWDRIDHIPDYQYLSVRKSIKDRLLSYVKELVVKQQRRNGVGEATIHLMTANLEPHAEDALLMGFARRFATYKRATLLFSDPERLKRILTNPERPGIIIFAGKAHPNDVPGQELIRTIHEYSLHPDFIGHILLIEGYDLALGRRLVAGVDVWLNTPDYPMEASGTSGQKAGMNGAVNVSLLDGWWAEGFDGNNGWGIVPRVDQPDPVQRAKSEGNELLDVLEHEVFPTYYDHSEGGYRSKWARVSKASMRSIIPRFNAQRMLMDYFSHLYYPALRHYRVLAADDAAQSVELAEWKARVHKGWKNVKIRLLGQPPASLYQDETIHLKAAVALDGFEHSDIKVECLIGPLTEEGERKVDHYITFDYQGNENGEAIYTASIDVELAGMHQYMIRMYPHHPALAHKFELGLMQWI